MARAWEQAGAAKEANAMLRGAQLARELGSVMIDKHLRPLEASAFVALTQPAHAQIVTPDGTVDSDLRGSRVPEAAVSGAMRRLASPLGLIARRAPGRSSRSTCSPPPTSSRMTPPPAAAKRDGRCSTRSWRTPAPRRAARSPPTPLKAILLDRLAPETTVVARTQDALAAPESTWPRPDPLAPAETGPHFPEPMYDGLARVAPALFLPGIEDVDQDGVALLETTPRGDRGLHGRPQPRAQPRAAVARVPGAAHRHRVPPVLDGAARPTSRRSRSGVRPRSAPICAAAASQLVLLVRCELPAPLPDDDDLRRQGRRNRHARRHRRACAAVPRRAARRTSSASASRSRGGRRRELLLRLRAVPGRAALRLRRRRHARRPEDLRRARLGARRAQPPPATPTSASRSTRPPTCRRCGARTRPTRPR